LSNQDFNVTVPGRALSELGDTVFKTELTDPGMARLWIESSRNDVGAYLATQDIPVILSGPDDLHRLLELTNGAAVFPADHTGLYRIRLGQTSRTGGRTSYEAVSLDPRLAPAFGTEERVLRQRTVVTRGGFELDTFEDASRRIQLAVSSGDEVEPGTFALVSVRYLGDSDSDDAPEELAVPLTWMAGQGVASGALRLGPIGRGLSVFVFPELVNMRSVPLDVLRRSLNRFANSRTRKALMQAVDLGAEQERDT
jgi:hypothetical protein